MKTRVCELCGGAATLHCESDAAFLCWACDARVHEANFLVARHVRRTLCCICHRFDGRSLSGVGFSQTRPVCSHCSPETHCSGGGDIEDDDGGGSCVSSSLSCSNDCSSGAGEKVRSGVGRRGRAAAERAEGVLANWARTMGVREGSCAAVALRAFVAGGRRFPAWPLRVCLAASAWMAANQCEARGGSKWQLRRLEECSQVPRKLILWAESRLSRAVKAAMPSREEGWAECSEG